ncbi:hypothetical protein [Nonomuraea gerenzanensis]|uniref:Uncharacterized protein n=1 Tax=Nonomuraea gerenzanensis TaxID=93944 RepID=A0A1M4EPI2_9ACTN|nr:hypothetical protein [Nonomuraea gerenzanensis]UBU12240.1 hypothetical protein LCN96_49485 [Nonomuraea gerenzanensis]SBP00772.1 FIG01124115: hypothetical protein [Nonomuraea gerenzanensis]
MRLRFSRGVITIAIIVVVLAVGVSVGLYQLLKRTPLAEPPEAFCSVTTPDGARTLSPEQAQIAATIAAVAARRGLPERAVVIAYATAMQESKIQNLDHGDRDSVGVFQQRESQGWGTKKQIMDPVYATNKFFAALVKVKNYRKIPLAEAAQAVQRSAGGYAYAPHETEAKILAAAFTGRVPKSVHCWYPPAKTTPAPQPRTAEARKQLARAMGSTAITTKKRGWLVAAWSVAHAERYALSKVGYNGATWVNDPKADGWRQGGAAGARKVELA